MCYRRIEWYKCMRPVLLTVDDNPQVVRAIERDLRRQYGKRFRVLKAESGQEALRLVKKLKLRNEILAITISRPKNASDVRSVSPRGSHEYISGSQTCITYSVCRY